ncbi:MAG: dTMP kinase [Candidatus Latescibacteria bacterium]|nr:dTMP kinase [Candidatus Latescibacterota bacterium]
MRGIFISFEGIDKSGKTTQAVLFEELLKREGYDVVLTREPGGTKIGEMIRGILKDTHHFGSITPMTELLLYVACRAQHTNEVIIPALERGAVVISDRFSDSTMAYQGYGRGLDLRLLQRVNDAATGGLEPDVTILLDLPVGEAESRQLGRPDRLEREVVSFHQRVAEGFRAIAREHPGRIVIIDGRGSREEVAICVSEVLTRKVEDYGKRI